MASKSLIVLAVVTAASVVAAAAALNQRAMETAAGDGGALVLPGLLDRINDIAVIRIRRGDDTLNLRSAQQRWTLAEKGDYPVRFEIVKTALVALARLRTIEAKTAKASLYPRLEVEDPTAAGAKSTQVTMLDGDGATLASIIVGKTRGSVAGVGRSGVYVRQPDQARAWLTDGDPKLPADAVGWLERMLVDMSRDRIAAAILTQPGGPAVEISREDKDQKDFTLAGLPEGHKVKDAYTLNVFGRMLEGLTFDDVTPAKTVDFAGSEARTAAYTSFDGVTVRFTLVATGGATWVRIRARAAADAGDDPRQEVAAINARTEGWAYRLDELTTEKMTTPLADLIAPEKD